VGSNNRTDAVDRGLIAEYATSTTTITKAVSNKALTSNVATLTTSTTHGFAVGDIVVVGTVDATFNGTYVVKAVPTTTTFTYDKTNANVTSAAVSPAGTAEVTTKRRFAGVIRDASDGVVKFFKDATTKPTSTIDFLESGLSYADIRVAGINAGAATLTSATIGSVSNTEIGYLSGVASPIQSQLSSRAPLIGPTFTGTVVLPSTTSIGDVDSSEIGYLNGVSSSIQTQLDAKIATATAASTYAPLLQVSDATKTFTANNYTLVLGDRDKILLLSNGTTAGTVTIPSGVFSVGSVLTIVQTNTGQLTITASGTTLNSAENKLKLNGQYASCQLICTAANTFLVIGNLAA